MKRKQETVVDAESARTLAEERKKQRRERWKEAGLSVCHGSAVEVLDDQLRHCVSCLEVQP